MSLKLTGYECDNYVLVYNSHYLYPPFHSSIPSLSPSFLVHLIIFLSLSISLSLSSPPSFSLSLFYLTPSLSCSKISLVGYLDSNNLLPLLECIPDSVTSDLLTAWLAHNVVPFLLQHVPQSLVRPDTWREDRSGQYNSGVEC